MTNGAIEAVPDYDPLERNTFDAIAYNVVGRASEVNTYPALRLTHSTGNSGWSVGIAQWDFGQPGRGEKVDELLAGYRQWALPERQFGVEQERDLSVRLRTRGQTGNALSDLERNALDEYLRSDPGREFVGSLDREQIARKWNNVGQPLSEIEWLRDLRRDDPAEATEIVAQAMKLYNQNEIRGRRLIEHLRTNELGAAQTSQWIGSDGINGLSSSAQRAIISGRDSVVSGARLMTSLEEGGDYLSQAWRNQVHDRRNTSLYDDFSNSPETQTLDAMFRNSTAGARILSRIDAEQPGSPIVIRGINATARLEMSLVELSSDSQLKVTNPEGNVFVRTEGGWTRDGVIIRDQGGAERFPLNPDSQRHPYHPLLRQIRSHVRGLDESVGRVYDEDSERLSRSLLAASRGGLASNGVAPHVLDRVDHVVLAKDGQVAVAVEGELDNPAHKRIHVDVARAMRTPVDQADQSLAEATRRQALASRVVREQEVQEHELHQHGRGGVGVA